MPGHLTDLSEVTHALYQQALGRAKRRMEQGNHSGAAAAYRQSAGHLREYANYAADAKIKRRRLDRAKYFLDLANELASGQYRHKEPGGAEDRAHGELDTDDYESDVTRLIYRSPATWGDIGGLEATKAEIKQAYAMSVAQKPPGVRLRGWRNILLFGPPGTGKTLLAAATSNGLDATFFNVKVSDLLSKYFGESTKLLSALYSLARRMSPSVVFLDEMESLSGQRGSSGQTGAEQRIVSTFLAELGGLPAKGEERYVLTIAATNLPWLLDRAILSRFEKRIYVPLPDCGAREAILRIHIDEAGLKSEVPHKELVGRTEGYSGREIQRLCAQAIEHMVAEENPSLVDLVEKGKEAIGEYRLRLRPLAIADFRYALDMIVSETREEDVAQFEKWRKTHAS